MTYGTFTSLAKGLLIGDNAFPNDAEVQLSLFGYACDKVINGADALRLFTSDSSNGIFRDGPYDSYVRGIKLPEIVGGRIPIDHKIDLDEELCYPLARFFVSFISKEKMAYHVLEAESLLRTYNSKVDAHINKLKQIAEESCQC